ncbi:hypothetical protein MIR68_006450 [Amoeboaphelidium protococcarum]|nr:hypothetical protein MIR68_006450 [Amoeboaphelidium protococcarum]
MVQDHKLKSRNIWQSFQNLPPLQRLGVTLSFTTTGIVGMYFIDDSRPKDQGFLQWFKHMALSW